MRKLCFLTFLLLHFIIKSSAQMKVVVQTSHTKPVTNLIFGGYKDEYLFTASEDGSIKMWDSKEGMLVRTLTGNNDAITGLQAGRHDEIIALNGQGAIIWWNFYTQKIVYQYESNIYSGQLLKHVGNKYLIVYCPTELCRYSNNFDIFNTENIKWIKLNDSLELRKIIANGYYLAGIDEQNKNAVLINFDNAGAPKKSLISGNSESPIAIAYTKSPELYSVLYSDHSIQSFSMMGSALTPKVQLNDTFVNLTSNNINTLAVWNTAKISFIKSSNQQVSGTFKPDIKIENITFIDSQLVLVECSDKFLVYDIKNENIIMSRVIHGKLSAHCYSTEKKLLAYAEKDSKETHIIDLGNRSYGYSLSSPIWEADYLYLLDSTQLYLINKNKTERILNLKTGKISDITSSALPNGNNDLSKQTEVDDQGTSITFTQKEVKIDTVTGKKNISWRIIRGLELLKYKGIAKNIIVSTDSMHIYVLDGEGKILSFKKVPSESDKIFFRYREEYTSIPFVNNNWAIIFPDNLYNCSKESVRWLSLKSGVDDYSLEEMDLFYNRPDIVLTRLGNTDATLHKLYYKAFEKRLKRNGLDTTYLGKALYRPIVEILEKEKIPVSTNDSSLNLSLYSTCRKNNLKSIQVYLNEVPVYGSEGIRIDALPKKKDKRIVNIPLTSGSNEIKIQAVDMQGIHSLFDRTRIYCNREVKEKNLYVITVSVSRYLDKEMNLKYAYKDGHDLAVLLAKSKQYKSVFIDSLFNENAILSSIIALKQKLLLSHPNDDVVLYFSGHGVLDSAYNFYFATHDIDFKNPHAKGLSYEQIEWLLDSIPAHNKLLLLDACHSGEVDKDEITVTEKQVVKNDNKGIKKYKGSELIDNDEVTIGMQNTFELMNELFSELSGSNGAIVISAAAGNSFALESDEWRNGVFTYCILQGIKNMEADANLDGIISVYELKKYTGKKVEELTHGQQKPTSRDENSRFDWRIW